MLIHLKNMTVPIDTLDYEIQNLILSCLCQNRCNIKSNSGNALFGENGVLIKEDYSFTDDSFFAIAASHGDIPNITLLQTQDREYTFNPSLFGWYNNGDKFLAQRERVAATSSVSGITYKDAVYDTYPRNIYIFQKIAQFANNSYHDSGTAINIDTEVYNFTTLKVSSIDRGNINTSFIRPARYRVIYFFNSDCDGYVGLIDRNGRRHYSAKFNLQIGGAINHTWVNESRASYTSSTVKQTYPDGVNHFNLYVDRVVDINENSGVVLSFSYTGGLIAGNILLDANYNFGLYLEEVRKPF